MLNKRSISIAVAFLGSVAMLSAQGRNRGTLPLKAGDPIPNVRGYLPDGKEFPLENLKGHFSVVVFGCLT